MPNSLAEIDELVSKKRFLTAIEKLVLLDQENPIVRMWTVECLFQLEYNDKLVKYIGEPVTVTEFSYLCESLWKLKKFQELKILIEQKRTVPEMRDSVAFKRFENKLSDCGK